MSIYGVDLSHWNKESDVLHIMNNKEYAFVILKATEGKSMVDELCSARYMQAYNKKIVGFYHYAHPELNDAETEALHFINTVRKVTAFNPNGKYFLALDWEGKAHNCDAGWAHIFLDKVHSETGIKALFYTSQSYAAKYDFLAEYDYGLWVARYNSDIGNVGQWTEAMWQYTNTPYDKNMFSEQKNSC